MTSRRVMVAVAAVVLLAGLAAAVYLAQMACPPPDWWLRVFVRSGNYGCLRVVE